jgi:hypothetical protein
MACIRPVFRLMRALSASALLILAACNVSPEAVSSGETTPLASQMTRHFARRPVVAHTEEAAVTTTSARVTHTIRRVTTQLVTLRTSEVTVVTTPEHPFAKLGAGWTRAAELAVGDRIVTHDWQDAAIVEVEVREVPPTPVYNLSVAKTHAYFVSDQDLLVHNMDCSPDRPSTSRPDSAELLRGARERHERAQNLIKRRKASLNYSPRKPNCSACTLASLTDVATIVRFFSTYGGVPGVFKAMTGLKHEEFLAVMDRLKLRSDLTPAPSVFPKTGSAPPFEDWKNVTKFMEESTANTFAVGYEIQGRAGHVLVGVRQVDGSIIYIEFQTNPPSIVDLEKQLKDVPVEKVHVIPTDVDWRMNRQLYWQLTKNDFRPAR